MAPSRVSEEKTYDYVICGGGTSGCVLAGRLAEDASLSILLVEAGADNADLESTHMAGGWANLFGTDGDWCIKNEPLKHANNRQVDLFRGRFLGGSSGCNECLTIRGTKQDFDDWDIPGWSGNEIFDYMKKSETFHNKDWFKAARHEHITILTQTVADKVIIEKEGGILRATGAELVARDGSRSIVNASREVVISGGAYCTPTKLLRSGLGGKAELAEYGIDCRVDLPGVGKNLMDHSLSFMFYEVNDPALTLDHLVYEEGSFASTYKLWKDEKKGMLSIFPFGIFAWLRLDERLKGNRLWEGAKAKAASGRDAMGLTLKQPHIEL